MAKRLDISKAAQTIGISAEDVIDIYRLFVEECLEKLPQLESALINRNKEQAERILHTLHGTAANLYAQELVDMTGSISNYVKAGDYEMALFVLNGAKQAVGELASELAMLPA